MKQLARYGLFFMLVCESCISATAQNKSNKGKEPCPGYDHNVLFTHGPPFNTQTHVLYLGAEQADTVTVTGSCKTNTASQQIIVFEKPTASFGSDRNICVDDSIRFADSSCIIQGSIVNWQWSFGDENSVTALNPSN